jgi:hypothetical protein
MSHFDISAACFHHTRQSGRGADAGQPGPACDGLLQRWLQRAPFEAERVVFLTSRRRGRSPDVLAPVHETLHGPGSAVSNRNTGDLRAAPRDVGDLWLRTRRRGRSAWALAPRTSDHERGIAECQQPCASLGQRAMRVRAGNGISRLVLCQFRSEIKDKLRIVPPRAA